MLTEVMPCRNDKRFAGCEIHFAKCYLAVDSAETLLELMAQIIHLILLQVELSPGVSQNAFIAGGPGLYMLQLAPPALNSSAVGSDATVSSHITVVAHSTVH